MKLKDERRLRKALGISDDYDFCTLTLVFVAHKDTMADIASELYYLPDRLEVSPDLALCHVAVANPYEGIVTYDVKPDALPVPPDETDLRFTDVKGGGHR